MGILIAAAGLGLGGLIAVRSVRRAPAAPPLDPARKARRDALLRSGERLIREGDLDAAIAALSEAREIDPDDARISRHLAAAERKGLHLRKAGEILDDALARRPDDPDLHLERAALLDQLGNLAAAAADCEAVLRSRPDDGGARLELGIIRLKEGRSGEAAASARRAIELGAGGARAQLLLGAASEAGGDLETAERAFRRSLDLDPSILEARHRLGQILVRTGRRDEGEAELRRGRRIAEQLQEIERLEASVASKQTSRRAEGSPGRMMDFAEELLGAYVGAFRFAEAEGRIRLAAEYRPLDEGFSFLLGVVLAGQGREEEARAALREAADRFPGSERIRRAASLMEGRARKEIAERETPAVLVETLLEKESP